jgi:hypothetical protein
MRRAWTAAVVPVFLSGMFAQEIRFSGPASRTKFRKSLLSDPRRYALSDVQVGPAAG